MKLTDRFYFGIWEGPRDFSMRDMDEAYMRYREMRKIGIDLIFLFAELADKKWLDMSLKAAEETGVKIIVDLGAVWRDKEKLTEYLENTKNSPAVIGYNVVDEPPLVWFPEVAEAVGIVQTAVPDKFVFSNLNPSYAPPDYLGGDGHGTTPYRYYLSELEKQIPADCISFDFYPYIGGEDREEKMKVRMLSDLSDIRAAADRMGVPFCGFLQSSRWGRYNENNEWQGTRQPDQTEFLWLANLHLVFGASMLTNFLYWSRSGKNPKQRVPGVFDGIISEDGSRTQMTDIVEKTIKKTRKYADKLLEYDFAGLLESGLTDQERQAVSEHLRDDFWGAKLKSDGKVLAGCFENHEKLAIYAMNLNDKDQNDVTVRIKRAGISDMSVKLQAGESVLIELTK